MAKGLTGNAVAYIRVSTGKQAKSGLGLEAQIEAIRAFAKRLGAAHPPDDISGRVEVRRGAGLPPVAPHTAAEVLACADRSCRRWKAVVIGPKEAFGQTRRSHQEGRTQAFRCDPARRHRRGDRA